SYPFTLASQSARIRGRRHCIRPPRDSPRVAAQGLGRGCTARRKRLGERCPPRAITSLSLGAEATTAWASAGKFPAGGLLRARPAKRSGLVLAEQIHGPGVVYWSREWTRLPTNLSRGEQRVKGAALVAGAGLGSRLHLAPQAPSPDASCSSGSSTGIGSFGEERRGSRHPPLEGRRRRPERPREASGAAMAEFPSKVSTRTSSPAQGAGASVSALRPDLGFVRSSLGALMLLQLLMIFNISATVLYITAFIACSAAVDLTSLRGTRPYNQRAAASVSLLPRLPRWSAGSRPQDSRCLLGLRPGTCHLLRSCHLNAQWVSEGSRAASRLP
uniref:Plasmolipin n=1 Tax=Papio anubis TaxID=9555 RepID=A0A8I5NQN9_PAPAN